MEIQNRRPGGSVDEVFGVTEQRLLEIVANAKAADGDTDYSNIGDMLHHNLTYCDTLEEVIVLAYMMGEYCQSQTDKHGILGEGGKDGNN